MQEAVGIVIFAVVALGAVAGLATLIGLDRAYDQIGRGGLSLDEPRSDERRPAGGAGACEGDEEIRQMLTARNARRAARGLAECDVETELRALRRPPVDAGLRAEMRDLVVARNARRVARGRAPLDVEAEIERRLTQL